MISGLRLFVRLAGLLALLWGAGFAWYLFDLRLSGIAEAEPAALLTTPPDPQAAARTAIVVLTGGSERIATGLKLLQQGYGGKLFISGVGGNTDFARLFAGLPRSPALESCCISLGRAAGNTIGNASETAAWVRQENLRAIILVTAHYHMRRSLLEFHMLPAAADLALHPYPVAPARVQVIEWWQRPRTALLLMTEYSKLLVTLLRYGLHNLA